MGRTKRIVVTGIISVTMAAGIMGTADAAAVHTVVKGDTYWKLSRQYNIDLDCLLETNGANYGSVLYVGQKVTIPDRPGLYVVQEGDTYWKIARKYNVDVKELLRINDANQNSVIYPGQQISLPAGAGTYIVQQGDTFWIISRKLNVDINELMKANNAGSNTVIYTGQVLTIPGQSNSGTDDSKPWVTHITHTVQQGDDFWKLGIQYGVPYQEILVANGLNEKSVIYAGQELSIPVHHVPVKPTPGPQFGELLDWWTEAQYVWVIGKDARVTDFYSGVQWNMRRTIGANHADAEPVTAGDTAIMKQVWGGSWSWARRPVIIEVDGRKIAASASAMPHDIYYIDNNNFNGHTDVHFYNSTRHKDGEIDEEHQQNIHVAAGK